MLLCDWADVRSGRSFVFLVTFLARLGRFEVDSINQIMSKANKCKMKKLHTDSGLASAIEFLFELNIPWVRDVKTTYIIKFIQRNRFLCRISMTRPRALSNVQHDLSLILGGPDRVWCGHPFPHSTSSVLIFAQDHEGQPISITSSFCCYTSHSIISRVPDMDLLWTAVVVPSKGMMDWHGNHFGPVAYKLEQLVMLGYRTQVVNWVEYFRALKERNNLKFLRNLLIVKQNKK